jgi:formate hydrogenlyase transcriptional activator
MGISIDITERKQAEFEKLKMVGRLAEAQRIGHIGSWEWDLANNEHYWSDEMYRLCGLERDGCVASFETFLSCVHPDDRALVEQACRAMVSGAQDSICVQHRMVTTAGQRIVQGRGEVTREQGQPVRIAGTMYDISERVQTEAQLRRTLEEVQQLRDQLQQENVALREQIQGDRTIVGESKAILKVLSQARRVAPTDSAVLLTGETGTGKELLAQAIHELSPRGKSVMVTVNCGALPATLIESELFGREKGAYTGAMTQQLGRFEGADGSTIFLDEISEIPFDLQSKLLRVLQEGKFERLGSARTRTVNVRVIAATNRNLTAMVREGQFRSDLFYRLNVFPIEVPPLRDRQDDVPLLVWNFVRHFAERMGKAIDSIPRQTMEQLKRYPWPGNVRELRNLMERAVILSDTKVLKVELPMAETLAMHESMTLAEAERRHIATVLERTLWRISGPHGAAALLGMAPSTLNSKMKKLRIARSTDSTDAPVRAETVKSRSRRRNIAK